LGRFWSVDPLARNYSWNSTYAFCENTPIWARELEGLEADKPNENNTIAIDPGHGIDGTKNSKVDPGAVGNDYYEKDIVLEIANNVNKYLTKWGVNTVMTRNGDITVEQEQISFRIGVAKDNNANIFISIHANSVDNPNSSGFLVCFNPLNVENGENSQLLAENIIAAQSTMPIKGTGYQYRSKLGVLNQFKGNAVVLIEVGFISNLNDVKLMTTNADQIGKEIATGTYKYLYNKEPSVPIIKEQPSWFIPLKLPQDNTDLNNPMGGW